MSDKTTITFRVDPQNLKKVDRYAKKMGLSRNQLLNNLVDVGLDDLRVLDAVGILVVGKGIKDLVGKIRSGEVSVEPQQELPI